MAKILIDIPNDIVKNAKNNTNYISLPDCEKIWKAVSKGICISNNGTIKLAIVQSYFDELRNQVKDIAIIDYAEELYDGGALVISYHELCDIMAKLLEENEEE